MESPSSDDTRVGDDLKATEGDATDTPCTASDACATDVSATDASAAPVAAASAAAAVVAEGGSPSSTPAPTPAPTQLRVTDIPRLLMQACFMGDAEAAGALLQQWDASVADTPGLIPTSLNQLDPRTGWSPLHVACARGAVALIRLLAQHEGVDVNAYDRDRYTGLGRALMMGHDRVAAELVLAGANVYCNGPGGITPLSLAVEEDNLEFVQFCHMKRVPLWNVCHKVNDARIIHVAATTTCGTTRVLSWLLRQWPKRVDERDSEGHTALLRACAMNDSVRTVATLLSAGASVSVASFSGRVCPLHAAAAHDVDSVRALLRAGASPNRALGTRRRTAAHVAARYGRVDVLQALAEAGANVLEEDARGNTPLHIAADQGHVDVLKLYETTFASLCEAYLARKDGTDVILDEEDAECEEDEADEVKGANYDHHANGKQEAEADGDDEVEDGDDDDDDSVGNDDDVVVCVDEDDDAAEEE